MKFKVYEKYYTDNKKTVTCVLDIKNAYQAIGIMQCLRFMKRECTPDGGGKKLPKNFQMNTTVKGIARLAEGDTFNYKVGAKIAREKAYKKLDQLANKVENVIVNDSKFVSENFKMTK
jgi:hypothetical protein